MRPIYRDNLFGDERLPQRFWDKVLRLPDGCWLWTATKNEGRYGQYKHNGKMCRVHRVAFETLSACIWDDRVVDHICRQPACCNPAHLQAVSQRENMARTRGVGKVRTDQCKHGHPYPENLVYYRGWIACRECRRISVRAGRNRCAVT